MAEAADGITQLSGAAGGAGVIGLAWAAFSYFTKKTDKDSATDTEREATRAKTAADALAKKDAVIEGFANRAFDLLEGDIRSLKDDTKDNEKRLSQAEGRLNMKDRGDV